LAAPHCVFIWFVRTLFMIKFILCIWLGAPWLCVAVRPRNAIDDERKVHSRYIGDCKSESIEDFAEKPDILEEQNGSQSVFFPGQNLSKESVGIRLRRSIFSNTGREITVNNASGHCLYATEGEYWTMHSHTLVLDMQAQKNFAQISVAKLSLHTNFEISGYDKICDSQEPNDKDPDGKPLYPIARVTKNILTFFDHWTVERYDCDGYLTTAYEFNKRYMFAAKEYFNVFESGSDTFVATVDQTYLISFTWYYDVWATKGVDLALVSILGIIIDIDHVLTNQGDSHHNNSNS
jgi:hypothetical protein